jgi:tetraacyldisaccharide 4'-kinase
MSVSGRRRILRILSGEDQRFLAGAMRGGLSLAEPVYASLMRARNRLYDHGKLQSHPLPRPTISIGNITTGGTGKTPLVRWLAEQLSCRGVRPAILMRGYHAQNPRPPRNKSKKTITADPHPPAPESTARSDEQRMLADYLGPRADVIANPDRLAGAQLAMALASAPDVFLLDDGFQHRRVRRSMDIVLIDATHPFGHGHVLPRGLLREPLSGLSRADMLIITRANLVEPSEAHRIETELRKWNRDAPILRANHELAGLKPTDVPAGEPPEFPIDDLLRRRFFVFAGIANPDALARQLEPYRDSLVGARWFPDHHAYQPQELAEVFKIAASAGAQVIVTTEKDWVKLASLPGADGATSPETAATEATAPPADLPPILRLELTLSFQPGDEQRLLEAILTKLDRLSETPAGKHPHHHPD